MQRITPSSVHERKLQEVTETQTHEDEQNSKEVTLIMEAVRSSEMSVSIYSTIWFGISQGNHIYLYSSH